MNPTLRNLGWRGTLWFVFELIAVLVLCVAGLPLLPSIIVPQIITILIVSNVIEAQINWAIQWAIWGGLCLDLLSPSRFGLIWLPTLILMLLLFSMRRYVSAELPSLWPVWFALAALIFALPLAIQTGAWLLLGESVLATTIWGVAILGFIEWVRSSRRLNKIQQI